MDRSAGKRRLGWREGTIQGVRGVSTNPLRFSDMNEFRRCSVLSASFSFRFLVLMIEILTKSCDKGKHISKVVL